MRFELNSRACFALSLLGCIGLLLTALYLQYHLGQEPCPLCIIQRICLLIALLIALCAMLHNAQGWGRRGYALGLLLMTAFGAVTAMRQVWLQYMPADQLPSCLPSLDYMIHALPFQEILGLLLYGTAECAEVSWTLLGLSIACWSLMALIGLFVVALVALLRRE